jgi:hypothetical protein
MNKKSLKITSRVIGDIKGLSIEMKVEDRSTLNVINFK